jgi:FKBP-type peptidyl-prolyl cis-trans isomerase
MASLGLWSNAQLMFLELRGFFPIFNLDQSYQWKSMRLAAIIVSVAFLIVGCAKMNKGVTNTGMRYEIIKEGTGPAPKRGDSVTVHYTGWLEDGTKFDSSVDRNQPFTFKLGVGQVIQGWDDGVATMKVGGKTKFFIPPELGYGSRGAGGVIPPNAKLIFEVELLSIK